MCNHNLMSSWVHMYLFNSCKNNLCVFYSTINPLNVWILYIYNVHVPCFSTNKNMPKMLQARERKKMLKARENPIPFLLKLSFCIIHHTFYISQTKYTCTPCMAIGPINALSHDSGITMHIQFSFIFFDVNSSSCRH